MSALTKAFVVVVTILAIAQVALIVPFVAKSEDYGARIQSLEDDLKIARALAAEAQRLRESELAAESARLANIRSLLSAFEGKVVALQEQVRTKEKAIVDEQQKLAALSATLSVAAAENKANSAAVLELTDQIVQVQEGSLDKNLKISTLTDRVQEVTTENQMLELQFRQSREEIQRLQAMLDDIMNPEPVVQEGADAEDVTVTNVNPPISGQITSVRTQGGLTISQINVGKGDNVKEKYVFLVFRGDQYIGLLRITSVQPRTAIGEFVRMASDPQDGDSVYAGPLADDR